MMGPKHQVTLSKPSEMKPSFVFVVLYCFLISCALARIINHVGCGRESCIEYVGDSLPKGPGTHSLKRTGTTWSAGSFVTTREAESTGNGGSEDSTGYYGRSDERNQDSYTGYMARSNEHNQDAAGYRARSDERNDYSGDPPRMSAAGYYDRDSQADYYESDYQTKRSTSFFATYWNWAWDCVWRWHTTPVLVFGFMVQRYLKKHCPEWYDTRFDKRPFQHEPGIDPNITLKKRGSSMLGQLLTACSLTIIMPMVTFTMGWIFEYLFCGNGFLRFQIPQSKIDAEAFIARAVYEKPYLSSDTYDFIACVFIMALGFVLVMVVWRSFWDMWYWANNLDGDYCEPFEWVDPDKNKQRRTDLTQQTISGYVTSYVYLNLWLPFFLQVSAFTLGWITRTLLAFHYYLIYRLWIETTQWSDYQDHYEFLSIILQFHPTIIVDSVMLITAGLCLFFVMISCVGRKYRNMSLIQYADGPRELKSPRDYANDAFTEVAKLVPFISYVSFIPLKWIQETVTWILDHPGRKQMCLDIMTTILTSLLSVMALYHIAVYIWLQVLGFINFIASFTTFSNHRDKVETVTETFVDFSNDRDYVETVAETFVHNNNSTSTILWLWSFFQVSIVVISGVFFGCVFISLVFEYFSRKRTQYQPKQDNIIRGPAKQIFITIPRESQMDDLDFCRRTYEAEERFKKEDAEARKPNPTNSIGEPDYYDPNYKDPDIKKNKRGYNTVSVNMGNNMTMGTKEEADAKDVAKAAEPEYHEPQVGKHDSEQQNQQVLYGNHYVEWQQQDQQELLNQQRNAELLELRQQQEQNQLFILQQQQKELEEQHQQQILYERQQMMIYVYQQIILEQLRQQQIIFEQQQQQQFYYHQQLQIEEQQRQYRLQQEQSIHYHNTLHIQTQQQPQQDLQKQCELVSAAQQQNQQHQPSDASLMPQMLAPQVSHASSQQALPHDPTVSSMAAQNITIQTHDAQQCNQVYPPVNQITSHVSTVSTNNAYELLSSMVSKITLCSNNDHQELPSHQDITNVAVSDTCNPEYDLDLDQSIPPHPLITRLRGQDGKPKEFLDWIEVESHDNIFCETISKFLKTQIGEKIDPEMSVASEGFQMTCLLDSKMEMVGAASYCILKNFVFVEAFAVDLKFRRGRAGSALIGRIQDIALERDKTAILLFVENEYVAEWLIGRHEFEYHPSGLSQDETGAKLMMWTTEAEDDD
ncbi:hypothetical protein HDU76_012577 [Blyttiomyces sp. JEL0837]|nr:hypothetical protein HDU76_012577 [Blyttiomyces sp. JEL0837]